MFFAMIIFLDIQVRVIIPSQTVAGAEQIAMGMIRCVSIAACPNVVGSAVTRVVMCKNAGG